MVSSINMTIVIGIIFTIIMLLVAPVEKMGVAVLASSRALHLGRTKSPDQQAVPCRPLLDFVLSTRPSLRLLRADTVTSLWTNCESF